jgi:cytochrome bd ubiquinol oxidase subunit I
MLGLVDPLDLARWQFGIVTVYHFLFVPVTIGLSAIVAGYETAWVRTGNQHWLRLTKFFGKLFLINFAIGVATGIVQEFQFGMNWSDYSRFVGDIFGAPLAVEGLLAFFLESTFLGLWIFGWDRLSPKLHATCIWLVHLGTLFSAYFILAANSWMQHPVGYTYNPKTGRAELHDFFAVLFNEVQLVTFPHVVTAAYMTAGAFVAGIAFWRFARAEGEARETFRRGVRTGAAVMLVAGIGVAISGDTAGKIMTEVQPMKMAAAEGLYDSRTSAPFSVLTVGSLNGHHHKAIIEIPGLLSFLGTGSFHGKIEGINQLRAEYKSTYGKDPGAKYYSPGDYTPIIPVTYWTFRFMIGVGLLAAGIGLLLLLTTRRSRAPSSPWLVRGAIVLPFLPIAANAFGWLFTEMGRQPWAVFGVMTTAQGVSPSVGAGLVATSLIAYILIYAVLIVIEVRLMLASVKADLPPDPGPPGEDVDDPDRPLAFAY